MNAVTLATLGTYHFHLLEFIYHDSCYHHLLSRPHARHDNLLRDYALSTVVDIDQDNDPEQ